EHEIGTRSERAHRPLGTRVGGVDHALAVGRRLDRVGGRRVIRAREAQPQTSDLRARVVVDLVPLERLAPITVDQLTEMRLDPFRTVDREARLLHAVSEKDVQSVDVDTVVGVLVRDHDGVEILDANVLLQVRERAVATVEPDRGGPVAQEVAAARAGRRRAERPRAPQDRQLHDHASTDSTSGPRNRTPSRRNVSTSPLVTKMCVTVLSGGAASPLSATRSRTVNAVSSALDTKTTSLPITSPIVRARRG